MRKVLLCSALALLAAGCKDGGTAPPVATTIAVTPGTVSMNAIGASQVVRAAVTDQKGKAMTGAAITWSSSAAAVTVAGAGGDSAIVTAVGNGPATITATSGGAAGSAAVQVAQTPAGLQKASGDAQTAPAGTALPAPLRVVVRDRLGAPVSGATVQFAAIGGGAVAAPTAVSGADGVATMQWTLGTVVGTTQMVTATLPEVSQVQFSATVVAGPASMAAAAGDNQNAAPGAAVPVAPRVLVRDAFNNPVPGVNVQFTVSSGGGSITGAASGTTDASGSAGVGGWTLGTALGTNRLTATFPGTSLAPVVFTAFASTAGSLAIAGGDNQAAMSGTAVPTAPSVRVRNASGAALPGLTVTFTVTGGGGTVGSATAVTDASGVARVASWRLGVGPNTLQATVAGVAAPPVTFRGVGCQGGGGSGFALTLCFTTPTTSSQREVFQAAAARWSTVITADLPDVTATVDEGDCGANSPRVSMTFDDLVIFATVENIDGPGNILGSAGPCVVRGGTRGLPILGAMRFDAADLDRLESTGGLSALILHEMGHVLGIGTLWNWMGLLQSPSSATNQLDTWFSGANGIAGFNAIGGSTYTGGQKVPVENSGGGGTINGHWRETVLANELMTGYLNSGVANPLSLLTVRSLTDMGYTVNTGAADAFSLSLSVNGSASVQVGGTPIKLHDDLYQGPLHRVDGGGRLTRIR